MTADSLHITAHLRRLAAGVHAQQKADAVQLQKMFAHLWGVRGVLLAPLVVALHLAMAASVWAAIRSRVRHWRCPFERGLHGACCRLLALEGPAHAHSRGP